MKRASDRRLLFAWTVVVGITLMYLVIDRGTDSEGVRRASTVASMTAIGLALAKLRIIMRELMDVRHAPKELRTLTDGLIVVMALALLGTYAVGRVIA